MQQTGKLKIIETFALLALALVYSQQTLYSNRKKIGGGKYTIFTTAEFSNELVLEVAKKLGGEKTHVTGIIISTNDLTGKLDFQNKKQFQGVKKYAISKEMSGNEIIELVNNFPNSFFALSFKSESDDTQLKIKPKAPKSGKANTKNKEKQKADFCKLTTSDRMIGQGFVFEKPDFKKAEITHHFIINEITPPKGETDFAKIREIAKRKGKIIREAVIDDKKMVQEIEFIA